MQPLIEHIARALVDHPEEVRVSRVDDEEEGGTETYELTVAGGDMGQVIGRSGRTARAIRAVVAAAASREGREATVEIVD